MTKFHALPATLLIVVASGLLSKGVSAQDFHIWIDGSGDRHISTIPRDGFTEQGRLRSAYDPNSLVAQHHAMRKALSEQSVAIAKQIAERQRLDNEPEAASPQTAARAPKEGIMGLRDLIKLERRGGRYSEK